MTLEQVFAAALMIQNPWEIEKIDFDPAKCRLDIDIGFSPGSDPLRACSSSCGWYWDSPQLSWPPDTRSGSPAAKPTSKHRF